MLTRLLVVLAIVMMGLVTGCEKKPQAVPEPETTVKTEEQMRTEAQKEITTENLDQQVDTMEKEIDADTQAAQ